MPFTMQSRNDIDRQLLIAELAGTFFRIAEDRYCLTTQKLLARIRDEWRSVPSVMRPWGFWVREYAALLPGADRVDFLAVPERVWFYDGRQYHPENVWKWMRFVSGQTLAPSNPQSDQFPLGRTAFAPYSDSDDYYLEVLWDGRYGMGWRVTSPQDRLSIVNKELWRA